MMRATVTRFDEELVANAKRFLAEAARSGEARALLDRFGYAADEHARGEKLVIDAERSFAWERDGRAYNFLAATPERRVEEARFWYADARRRHLRACVKRAEEAAGVVGDGAARRWPLRKKLTVGVALAVSQLARAASVATWRAQRAELARDLERARAPRPTDAPPPKDTVLVELGGWYERWRLLAHRVMRGRPDLLAGFGLVAGKAPPRLRGKEARLKYGEGAAGTLKGAPPPTDDDDDDETAEDEHASPAIAAAPAPRGKALPILR